MAEIEAYNAPYADHPESIAGRSCAHRCGGSDVDIYLLGGRCSMLGHPMHKLPCQHTASTLRVVCVCFAGARIFPSLVPDHPEAEGAQANRDAWQVCVACKRTRPRDEVLPIRGVMIMPL